MTSLKNKPTPTPIKEDHRMKAKFIRKYCGTGYDRNFMYMDYEYRNHTYTVYINTAKGNEPLSWQHKNNQAQIDKIIESKSIQHSDGKPFDLNEIWETLGWD